MVLGSLYLHTQRLSWQALAVSLVPGCLIMALAVVNAIPDFHQDRLVGKRNLVVRLGRAPRRLPLPRRSPAAGLLVVPVGVAAGIFPWPCLAALLALPLLVASGRIARSHLRAPRAFLPAMRNIVACYLVARAAAHRGHPGRRPAGRCAHEPHRPARAPLLVTWQLTRDCDLVLPALLHRVGAGQAPARRARRATRPCASPTRSSAWACPT